MVLKHHVLQMKCHYMRNYDLRHMLTNCDLNIHVLIFDTDRAKIKVAYECWWHSHEFCMHKNLVELKLCKKHARMSRFLAQVLILCKFLAVNRKQLCLVQVTRTWLDWSISFGHVTKTERTDWSVYQCFYRVNCCRKVFRFLLNWNMCNIFIIN